MADERLKQIIKALEGKTFLHKGQKAIAMEDGRLDFKKTFILKKILKSGNVRLGDPLGNGDNIAKVRRIGEKETLTIGSGRGTGNFYLDLF